MAKEKHSIYYGDGDGAVDTPEGKLRLLKEENIIYLGGVHAFKIIPREKRSALVQLYFEDDGQIFSRGEVVFDVAWLVELSDLINFTIEKLKG